jgi:hypothetical protein
MFKDPYLTMRLFHSHLPSEELKCIGLLALNLTE